MGGDFPWEFNPFGHQFQLTPPHGGRRCETHSSPLAFCFNSRPRMGGDVEQVIELVAVVPFQLTPPHGGRPGEDDLSDWGIRSFNSRPRMGGDDFPFQFVPVRGFQLTPPHGGRRCYTAPFSSDSGFNSRPRMGGDIRRIKD